MPNDTTSSKNLPYLSSLLQHHTYYISHFILPVVPWYDFPPSARNGPIFQAAVFLSLFFLSLINPASLVGS